MGAEDNRKTTVAAYEAFGRGDIAAILEIQADDVVWDIHSSPNSPLNGTHIGRDSVGTFFQLIGENIDFAKFEIAPIAAEGDIVVAYGEQDYTVKSTGKRVAGPLIHKLTYNSDGKLAHFEEWESNTEGAFTS